MKKSVSFSSGRETDELRGELERCEHEIAQLKDAQDLLKGVQDTLQESQRFLSTLISNLPGMVYRCRNDRYWTMEFVSEGCKDLTGYDPADILFNRRLSYNQLINPDDCQEVWDQVQSALREGQPFKIVYRITTKDGREKWVWEQGRGIRSPDGSRLWLEGFITDITERKLAENAMRDEKSRAELYLDIMGHDINNMDQVALGYLEMAAEIIDRGGCLGDKDKTLIDRPIESLKNSSRLIDNVKKLQRAKMGLYERRVFDLGEVIREVISRYLPVPGREVSVNYDPVDRCKVEANDLLDDVFANILGNAIQHSTGPLIVNVRQERTLENGRAYCQVSVEDNGPGIIDDLKRKLFDRYCLVTTKASGRGFGLCLVRNIVDEFRGRVWVEDRVPGDHTKGSRFVVALPAAE